MLTVTFNSITIEVEYNWKYPVLFVQCIIWNMYQYRTIFVLDSYRKKSYNIRWSLDVRNQYSHVWEIYKSTYSISDFTEEKNTQLWYIFPIRNCHNCYSRLIWQSKYVLHVSISYVKQGIVDNYNMK